jgi:hypothetical protein
MILFIWHSPEEAFGEKQNPDFCAQFWLWFSLADYNWSNTESCNWMDMFMDARLWSLKKALDIFHYFVRSLKGRLADWPTSRLADWPTGRLADWLTICVFGQKVCVCCKRKNKQQSNNRRSCFTQNCIRNSCLAGKFVFVALKDALLKVGHACCSAIR